MAFRPRHRHGHGASHNFPGWLGRLALVLALALVLVPATALAWSETPRVERSLQSSPDGVPLRLVLALDGIPYDVFVGMQRQGWFADFRPAARMVSTFPSLSDVAFAAIDGSEPPDGYQTTHFDPARNKLVGNTISSLSERSHPKIAADSRQHTTVHRVLGYVSSNRVALSELRQIGKDLLHSRKETFVAYVGTSDAVLHLEGRAGAERFLRELDAVLRDLQANVTARTGRRLLVDIVSDHGSTLVANQLVPVDRELERCGFRRRSRITQPFDAAYSLPGIVGSVAITVSPEHAEEAARCLAPIPGVDLVAIDRGGSVGILTADGEAEVRLSDAAAETYSYRALRGDPLGLLPDTSTPGGEHSFEQAALFLQTLDAPRPDPLRRIWRAFHGEVKKPSTILLSLADGYEVGNPALRFMTRLRGGHLGTHGSMTRMASLGVFASNWRDTANVNAAGAHQALFGTQAIGAMRHQRADPATATQQGR